VRLITCLGVARTGFRATVAYKHPQFLDVADGNIMACDHNAKRLELLLATRERLRFHAEIGGKDMFFNRDFKMPRAARLRMA